jgi:hypothetical protein
VIGLRTTPTGDDPHRVRLAGSDRDGAPLFGGNLWSPAKIPRRGYPCPGQLEHSSGMLGSVLWDADKRGKTRIMFYYSRRRKRHDSAALGHTHLSDQTLKIQPY